jgi:hypothetical protein
LAPAHGLLGAVRALLHHHRTILFARPPDRTHNPGMDDRVWLLFGPYRPPRLRVSTIWKMRKALDVTWTNDEETQRLVWHAALRGAEAVKVKEWTEAERAAERRLNAELNLVRNLRLGYHGPRWTRPSWTCWAGCRTTR